MENLIAMNLLAEKLHRILITECQYWLTALSATNKTKEATILLYKPHLAGFFLLGEAECTAYKKSKKYNIQGNCIGSGKGGDTDNGVQEFNRHFKVHRHLAHFVVCYFLI